MVCGAPLLALAADSVIGRHETLSDIPTITWLFLCGFAMLGWAVSELDHVAELWNIVDRTPYEIWKARLSLMKGVAAANAAGLLVYLLGSAAPAIFFRAVGVTSNTADVPEMLLFVFVSGAGYMGVRWFAWIERKFLS